MVGIALLIAIGAIAGGGANASGPSAINLRTAANFSVLAGSAVTNTGPTTTDRDVGVWRGTSISGFTGAPSGTAGGSGVHAGDPVAQQAQSDLTSAYLAAAGLPVTASHTTLGGLNLVGGVYDSGGAVLDITGTLTLDGQFDPSSVWVFKASSDLVTASSSKVVFVNGASPCNVFWQVTRTAILGSGSTFGGTIMALTSVTSAGGSTIYGRALARNAEVTLINDRFLTLACNISTVSTPTLPPCAWMANIPNAPCAGTRLTAATPVSATATPSTPSATPTVASVASATPTAAPRAPTVAPGAVGPPAANVAGTQSLPSTSTNDPSGLLATLGVALAGFGILLLARPIRHL